MSRPRCGAQYAVPRDTAVLSCEYDAGHAAPAHSAKYGGSEHRWTDTAGFDGEPFMDCPRGGRCRNAECVRYGGCDSFPERCAVVFQDLFDRNSILNGLVCVYAGGHDGHHLVRAPGSSASWDYAEPVEAPATRPGNAGQYDTTSPYEPIKIIEHYNLNFALGNVIKYVLRAGKKPGVSDIEDLEKARQNITFEIERRRRVAKG